MGTHEVSLLAEKLCATDWSESKLSPRTKLQRDCAYSPGHSPIPAHPDGTTLTQSGEKQGGELGKNRSRGLEEELGVSKGGFDQNGMCA